MISGNCGKSLERKKQCVLLGYHATAFSMTMPQLPHFANSNLSDTGVLHVPPGSRVVMPHQHAPNTSMIFRCDQIFRQYSHRFQILSQRISSLSRSPSSTVGCERCKWVEICRDQDENCRTDRQSLESDVSPHLE